MIKRSVLFIICLPFSVLAETSYMADVGHRSDPVGTNVAGIVAHDQVLWGAPTPSNPFYGYYRIGGQLGGSPTAAAFLQIAPIAPLIFEVQRGFTHRLVKGANFNCEKYECQGRVDRTDYSIKLAAAYKRYVLLNTFRWRDIQTPSSEKNIVLDLEYFTVTPGSHRYFETISTLGYRLNDDQLVGLLYHGGLISEGERRFQSYYGIYRRSWKEYSFAGGAGTYRSDEPLEGVGIILSVSAKWGESLSLF